MTSSVNFGIQNLMLAISDTKQWLNITGISFLFTVFSLLRSSLLMLILVPSLTLAGGVLMAVVSPHHGHVLISILDFAHMSSAPAQLFLCRWKPESLPELYTDQKCIS